MFYPEPIQEEIEEPIIETEPVAEEPVAAVMEEPGETETEENSAEREHDRPNFGAIKDKALQGVASGAGWLRSVEDKAESMASAGKQVGVGEVGSHGKDLSPLTKALIAIWSRFLLL